MKEQRLRNNFLLGLFVVGMCIFGLFLLNQNSELKQQLQDQRVLVEEHKEILEAESKKGLAGLMANVLDQIDHELQNSSDRKLSNEIISRIATFSDACLPNPLSYIEYDSISKDDFSKERAYLLLTLYQLNLDSSTFAKIKRQTSFSRADLGNSKFTGADLSGIDLMSANLKGADLSGSNLTEADLRGANLWGANLNGSNLQGAQLNRADLGWVEMNDADLKKAILKGANLASAKLRNADMRGADVQFSNLNQAILSGANLANGTIYWSDLSRSNLSGVDLTKVDMRRTNLIGTNLNEARLDSVRLAMAIFNEEDWLAKLSDWRVKGAREIQEIYRIKESKSSKAEYTLELIKQ